MSLSIYQIQTETNVHEHYLHIPIFYIKFWTDTKILYKNYIPISEGLKMERMLLIHQFHLKF